MVEPATTGTIVAAALATAAGALARGALGSAGKDAYDRLKALFTGPAATSAAQLEETRGADALARVLAALIDDAPAAEQAAWREQAERLRAALAAEGHGDGVDRRLMVLATEGGRAAGRDQYNAGRDQYIGAAPPDPTPDG
jgi:hypothetical protein